MLHNNSTALANKTLIALTKVSGGMYLVKVWRERH